jgi:radical SAM protein with 4Fe4S-binding SPASM domain
MGDPCVAHPGESAGFRNGHELLAALASRQRAPVAAHLQVADRCNHACAHCYQVQGERGELSFAEVVAVLDRLAAAGVLMLNVSGGEATLRHDLVDILRAARARGFALRLYTNAFLIDDALAAAVAGVGILEAHVSLYSDRAADHDAVTRVPGSWERTTRGVRALRARGVRVVLKVPATSLTPGGAMGVERLARELGCAFIASSEITPREDGSLETLAVAPDPAALVRDGLLKPWTPGDDQDALRRKKIGTSSCGVGTKSLVVLSNGDIQACTDTPLVLGNLATGSWDDAMRSPAIPLFHALTWGDVHGCRDCDLLGACARCHASALHEGGDYLGPYAGACARARARYAAGHGGLEVLPPAEGCAPGRSALLGPYRIEGPGRLRPIADVVTEEDEARARQHPWLRRAEAPSALVPLRLRRDDHPP